MSIRPQKPAPATPRTVRAYPSLEAPPLATAVAKAGGAVTAIDVVTLATPSCQRT